MERKSRFKAKPITNNRLDGQRVRQENICFETS
jgi:hypothetical protein